MKFVLETNSERETLHIPEYGRHIQKLVNNCKEIEDDELRNKMAKAIVEVMGNLQPHLRDIPDFSHKLWDQLFIIADFDLDVDSPHEKLTREEIQAKPKKLAYPQNPSKYRFYGNNIQIMINEAVNWEEGEMRETLSYTIANHMKKCFLNWNKDTVDDDVIFKHLLDLSDGKIDMFNKEVELSPTSVLLKKKTPNSKHKKKNNNKKHNGRKRW